MGLCARVGIMLTDFLDGGMMYDVRGSGKSIFWSIM